MNEMSKTSQNMVDLEDRLVTSLQKLADVIVQHEAPHSPGLIQDATADFVLAAREIVREIIYDEYTKHREEVSRKIAQEAERLFGARERRLQENKFREDLI